MNYLAQYTNTHTHMYMHTHTHTHTHAHTHTHTHVRTRAGSLASALDSHHTHPLILVFYIFVGKRLIELLERYGEKSGGTQRKHRQADYREK